MVSRKEIEEKRRKDEMEAAHVFEEFIQTFQSTNTKPVTKTWIKAGMINLDKPVPSEVNLSTLYKPMPRLKAQDKSTVEQAQECARILHVDRKSEKKKSNLESFKEELELFHKDREERQRVKEDLKFLIHNDEISYHVEQGEPHSTNLFVNNLNTKMTEHELMELFGKYGPLASVKIMWPRSEEERNRNKNCGFVAYMSRKDAERGLKYLHNKTVMDCELKVGWGKAVLLPSHPIYIPPSVLELSQPPPPSGLPFNAQLINPISSISSFDDFLKHTVIKVVIPSDRTLVALIHRMVEFVIREGFLFEAIIMTQEINNPSFRFLFDNQSPAHIYYRWKLFSVLQGDCIKEWRTKEFRMFEGGSIWKPPIVPNYSQGMPNELFDNEEKTLEKLKKSLSSVQRDNLEYLIHKLTPERSKLVEAMVFCINHIEAHEEIVECITQALENNSLTLKKIIARLYLISDILHNSRSKSNTFKKAFEANLPLIMKNVCNIYKTLPNEDKYIMFNKITRIFNAWAYWNIFNSDYLKFLYKLFSNIETSGKNQENESLPENTETDSSSEEFEVKNCKDDKEELSAVQEEVKLPGFIPSRWEVVDPDIIESQAMTTSKWSQLQDIESNNSENNSITKSKTISEDKRKKLREIEVKVMEFEDQLEMDKSNVNISEQVENYRNKLIKQYEEKLEGEKNSKRKNGNSPKKYKKSHKSKYY